MLGHGKLELDRKHEARLWKIRSSQTVSWTSPENARLGQEILQRGRLWHGKSHEIVRASRARSWKLAKIDVKLGHTKLEKGAVSG